MTDPVASQGDYQHDVLIALRDALGDTGLSPTSKVLFGHMCVARLLEPMPTGDGFTHVTGTGLAEQIGASRQTISLSLDQLESLGYIDVSLRGKSPRVKHTWVRIPAQGQDH